MTKDTKIMPGDDTKDLLKKLLMVELFRLGIPQSDIAKKIRTDIKAVNTFLKGIKKN